MYHQSFHLVFNNIVIDNTINDIANIIEKILISIKPTKAYARPKIAMLYGINGIESILVIPKAIAYSNDKVNK